MIYIGAKVGGIGLGIYGMVGVCVLVFVFGLKPGAIPIDVMLIIVSVITASAALQAAGGLDYMVNMAARFLKKHPSRITFFAPLTTWLFTILAGTAHTSYALLPIISEALLGDRSIGMTEIMGARWAVLAFLMGVPPMVLLVHHSFQLAGFITTFVSIGVGYLLVTLLY